MLLRVARHLLEERYLRRTPISPGVWVLPVSEGLEYAERNPGYAYCLGSILNHVLIHQSIIGLETMKQFDLIDEKPDMTIGCLGGGSNFGDFILPFAGEVVKGKRECKFLAAQSSSAPNLVRGEYRYDYGDHAEKTPRITRSSSSEHG
jgi:tryptophan synthase beta chain